MEPTCDFCGASDKNRCRSLNQAQGCAGGATVPDIIVKPVHYTRWKIEPITFIMRNGFEFWRANIVKYASRAGFKFYEGQDAVESEITDLKKVIRYAEMRINQLQGEPEL